MVVPLTLLTGKRLKASTTVGLLLSWMLYSREPILAVPVGRMRLCRFNAADVNGGAVDARDRQAVKGLDHGRAVVELDAVFPRADFSGARGQDEAFQIQRRGYIKIGRASCRERV